MCVLPSYRISPRILALPAVKKLNSKISDLGSQLEGLIRELKTLERREKNLFKQFSDHLTSSSANYAKEAANHEQTGNIPASVRLKNAQKEHGGFTSKCTTWMAMLNAHSVALGESLVNAGVAKAAEKRGKPLKKAVENVNKYFEEVENTFKKAKDFIAEETEKLKRDEIETHVRIHLVNWTQEKERTKQVLKSINVGISRADVANIISGEGEMIGHKGFEYATNTIKALKKLTKIMEKLRTEIIRKQDELLDLPSASEENSKKIGKIKAEVSELNGRVKESCKRVEEIRRRLAKDNIL